MVCVAMVLSWCCVQRAVTGAMYRGCTGSVRVQRVTEWMEGKGMNLFSFDSSTIGFSSVSGYPTFAFCRCCCCCCCCSPLSALCHSNVLHPTNTLTPTPLTPGGSCTRSKAVCGSTPVPASAYRGRSIPCHVTPIPYRSCLDDTIPLNPYSVQGHDAEPQSWDRKMPIATSMTTFFCHDQCIAWPAQ